MLEAGSRLILTDLDEAVLRQRVEVIQRQVATGEILKWSMPQWFQQLTAYAIIYLTFGGHSNYGLSQPNYRLFDKHPTLNNEVPYYIKHGRILPKPAVRRLDG
ncbi:MAG: hypothetical protein PUP92_15590 [Rhizonema sp. PD38]|nr:hypothetical protein [Rhizonema sp. PD38]